VVNALHWKSPGSGFESGSYLYLWDLFPQAAVSLPYVIRLTSAEEKKINSTSIIIIIIIIIEDSDETQNLTLLINIHQHHELLYDHFYTNKC